MYVRLSKCSESLGLGVCQRLNANDVVANRLFLFRRRFVRVNARSRRHLLPLVGRRRRLRRDADASGGRLFSGSGSDGASGSCRGFRDLVDVAGSFRWRIRCLGNRLRGFIRDWFLAFSRFIRRLIGDVKVGCLKHVNWNTSDSESESSFHTVTSISTKMYLLAIVKNC